MTPRPPTDYQRAAAETVLCYLKQEHLFPLVEEINRLAVAIQVLATVSARVEEPADGL